MPYGKSPNKMGHSPAEMESAKQEKYNLLHDNPVAKHASGSWMSCLLYTSPRPRD